MKNNYKKMAEVVENVIADAKFQKSDDPLFVTSLARGLAILQSLGTSDKALTMTQIAKLLKLPQPTVWRLCHTMIELGYLERTDENRVRPGLALLGLGYAALSQRPLSELARPGMEMIAKQFPGAVSLGIRQDLEMLYIHRVEGGAIVFAGLRTGSRVSLLASAIGWGYVAGLPKKERSVLLASAKQSMPKEYSRVSSALEVAINDYPIKGLIVNTGVLHPEINAIAVPVGILGSTPMASLSFGGPRSKFSVKILENEVGPKLRALARNLAVS